MKIQPNLIAALAVVMTLTATSPTLAGFEFTVSSASLVGSGNFNQAGPNTVQATFNTAGFTPHTFNLVEGQSFDFKLGEIALPTQTVQLTNKTLAAQNMITANVNFTGAVYTGVMSVLTGPAPNSFSGLNSFSTTTISGTTHLVSMSSVFSIASTSFAGGDGLLLLQVFDFVSNSATIATHAGTTKDIYARVTLLLAPSTVPEPGTSALFVTGLLGLAGASRRRKARD